VTVGDARATECDLSAGGAVGVNGTYVSGWTGEILNTYALGAVTAGSNACVGGLVASNWAQVRSSYAAGQVGTAGPIWESQIGGFAGWNHKSARNQRAYWDTDTSRAAQACGKGHCANVVGLQDSQLKSGLPAGFDPKIWGQSPNINNGYPYLLANPPK
jgi:hypothetical protein